MVEDAIDSRLMVEGELGLYWTAEDSAQLPSRIDWKNVHENRSGTECTLTTSKRKESPSQPDCRDRKSVV